MTDQTVAVTILKQLGGLGRLRAMINIQQIEAKPQGIRFKFSNPNRSKPNHVEITLNGRDLYDIDFGRTVKYDVKPKSKATDIYASDLRGVIEQATELYLSL